jgi:type VI secretion system protein ImpM
VVIPVPGEAVSAPAAILFGKLPRHGDFISRGLSADRRIAWDGWLSTALEDSRRRLGEGFSAAHDAAPPWRFVAGPGRFGVAWRAGALAASIDAVGRRFFIVLAADNLSPGQASAHGEHLAETMEALIYRAFERDWDADTAVAAGRDQLGAILADGDGVIGHGQGARARWWTAWGNGESGAASDEPPADLIGEAAPPSIGLAPA